MTDEQIQNHEQKVEYEDTNIIFIGEKPFMNYVTGVVTQFKTKNQKEVIIKARGKFISRAVDVAEVSAKKFLKEENITVKDIKINSEEFENKEGRKVNVSTIDITLEKH
jgi:archaea-specific DNA-binding protein